MRPLESVNARNLKYSVESVPKGSRSENAAIKKFTWTQCVAANCSVHFWSESSSLSSYRCENPLVVTSLGCSISPALLLPPVLEIAALVAVVGCWSLLMVEVMMIEAVKVVKAPAAPSPAGA